MCVCVCVCLCLCVYVCSCVCVSYRRQHRCTHGHTYPCYGGSEHATRRLPATRPTSPSEQSGSCCCTCIHRYVFHSQVRDTYITARCADACGDAHIPRVEQRQAGEDSLHRADERHMLGRHICYSASMLQPASSVRQLRGTYVTAPQSDERHTDSLHRADDTGRGAEDVLQQLAAVGKRPVPQSRVALLGYQRARVACVLCVCVCVRVRE